MSITFKMHWIKYHDLDMTVCGYPVLTKRYTTLNPEEVTCGKCKKNGVFNEQQASHGPRSIRNGGRA